MIETLSKKDGIKRAIDATRLTLKAIDEDMSVIREYAAEAGEMANLRKEHIPSQHYPSVYLAKCSGVIEGTYDTRDIQAFIRIHEDSPFVCTGISLLTTYIRTTGLFTPALDPLFGLRLTDESSGRQITNAPINEWATPTAGPLGNFFTVGVPMSVFKTSMAQERFYQGQNFYYELPAEIAFPKNGVIRAQVFTLDADVTEVYVALIGYKILGG